MSDLPNRKDSHLDIVLGESVEAPPSAIGLGRWTLEYDALPEVDLDEVDLSTTAFGRKLRAPLIIGAMTGGTARAGEINRILARAAEKCGVGFALGSQRAMIVDPSTSSSFAVREVAPDLPLLFGNIGAIQLNYGMTVQQIRDAVERVDADVLNFHLNPLQEAIQPEGDTRFKGLFAALTEAIPQIPIPCVIKEVGAGMSARAAKKVAALPISGLEVAGTGGTSWAAVESYRAGPRDMRAEVGRSLAGFGVPTADSIRIGRTWMGERTLIASGGLRSGMDLAVSLALGADLVAMARPFLDAATLGESAVIQVLERLIFELRVICFCCGARQLTELRQVRVLPVSGMFPVDG